MSKSPNSNIFIPAIGGAALLLGGAFGIANIGYGNDRIETLQQSLERERSAAEAQVTRVAELEAALSDTETRAAEQLVTLEQSTASQLSGMEQQLATLKAQLEAASQGNDLVLAASSAAATSSAAGAPATGAAFGLGRAAFDEELAAWDVDVLPDGRGLPEGSGDVWTGDEVFGEQCAACHGDFAEGRDAWPVLAGGFDTLDDRDPVKTVGSYWPYLSTVWDYVHRSMPFGAAGTLSDDEVYAITAYILYSNDLVDDDFVLSRETFADVAMYNADGFIVDDRPVSEYPLWTGEPCMTDCKSAPVEITRRSSDVGVTPADDGSMAESLMEQELASLGGNEWGAERVAGSVFMDPDAAAEEEAAMEAEPEEQVASTETASTETATDATEVSAGPDSALVAAGETAFRQCASCHQIGAGAKNRSGPQLNGVYGRVVGSVEGFRYSNAVKDANSEGVVWNDETLAGFLADPKGYLKGTRMSFRGVRSDEELEAIIAYLASFAE